MFKLLVSIMTLVISYTGLSTTYYVNGSLGNDRNDGKTQAKSFKTINKAVTLVKGNDEIVIEGRQGNKEIVYNEAVFIDKAKFSLKLKGENTPIIDGSKISNDSVLASTNYCALRIESNLVEISGLTIRNFEYNGDDIPGVFGAGIYFAVGSSKNVIRNNAIENCNWGIYLDGNSLDIIEENSIQNIKLDGNDNGGTGIYIAAGGIGIESNIIGGEKGNTIKAAEKYGVCLGSLGAPVNADNSSISMNTIEECKEAGLAVFNIEGIVSITKNVFRANETALFIGGMPIDTKFADNLFNGSTGKSEIVTGPDYDGYLLFDIWKRNNNKFKLPTFAAVNPDQSKEEVLIGPRGGFIRNNADAAKDDAGDNYNVLDNK